MPATIDPSVAASVTHRIARAMMDCLCASTPMLSWHGTADDGGAPIAQGGSTFLVRTPTGIIGITADHVIGGFAHARQRCPGLIATLGGSCFDPEPRLIGRCSRIDVATFRIDEGDLAEVGFQPLEHAWPPATPASGGIVLLAGWPGQERVVTANLITGGLYVGWGSAGVSDVQITIRVDQDQGLFSPIPGVPAPPAGFEFGGISGGPVMMINSEEDGRKIGWRVAGVITEGKPEYDYIVATRADAIQDDGRIRSVT